eukprot:Lithocolla_globosa_v1_NODE_6_length_11976_cov_15.425432.p9 type:complete len:189 gc:universal NODE_6_length_11976_cov_15.425432:11639-11073(-)
MANQRAYHRLAMTDALPPRAMDLLDENVGLAQMAVVNPYASPDVGIRAWCEAAGAPYIGNDGRRAHLGLGSQAIDLAKPKGMYNLIKGMKASLPADPRGRQRDGSPVRSSPRRHRSASPTAFRPRKIALVTDEALTSSELTKLVAYHGDVDVVAVLLREREVLVPPLAEVVTVEGLVRWAVWTRPVQP